MSCMALIWTFFLSATDAPFRVILQGQRYIPDYHQARDISLHWQESWTALIPDTRCSSTSAFDHVAHVLNIPSTYSIQCCEDNDAITRMPSLTVYFTSLHMHCIGHLLPRLCVLSLKQNWSMNPVCPSKVYKDSFGYDEPGAISCSVCIMFD